MERRPLIALVGVLLATMAGDINDQSTALALVDLRGGLGISNDAGSWIESLYLSAQPIGMLISAWFMVTLTLRRWLLAVIALVAVTSVLLPLTSAIEIVYALRILQGLAGGLITPLLMDAALFVLPPAIKLYGLAIYALTATFLPMLTPSIVAFWTDTVGIHTVYHQALPMCAVGGFLVWWGFPGDEAHLKRFKQFNWRGLVLGIVGVCALTTMLFHGDRLDWFNSPLVIVLCFASAAAIPLFLVNEWFHPLPFLKLQMLARRNFLYGVAGLFGFIILMSSATVLPLQFLVEVGGYRPAQAQLVTLPVALVQPLLLAAVAFALDRPAIDARVVGVLGLCLMTTACILDSFVTVDWTRDQFLAAQLLQAVGLPMVAMPLLMLSTNEVLTKAEAPFASALVNFPRSIAEVVAIWLVGLITRWRGALHSDRLSDQLGDGSLRLFGRDEAHLAYQPGRSALGSWRMPVEIDRFAHMVEQQAATLVFADGFRIMAAFGGLLILLFTLLPVRSPPPRIKFKAVLT